MAEQRYVELSEIIVRDDTECPICLQVMLNDPHLVSCCGHHFCGTCIKRVKASNGACPYCKEKEYQTIPVVRTLNGLKVNCTNKDCEWKGDLKDLPVHLNKGKREGQCQYEVATCKNYTKILKTVHKCKVKLQRWSLQKHEISDCPHRPGQCNYCQYKGTYKSVIEYHYPECTQYPVPCPNKCGLQAIPRCNIQTHVTEECPLQSVECEFKWAGCQYTLLRKHIQQHNNDSQLKHMSLLAKECRELKKENKTLINDSSKLKKENEELTQEIESMEREYAKLKRQNQKLVQKMICLHNSIVGVIYPILPVRITLSSEELHFYSDIFGHHISVSVRVWGITRRVIFTVYKGKFQHSKVTKVVVKLNDTNITLTTNRGCYEYCEYLDDVRDNDNVNQKFSFRLTYLCNLEIVSIY